MRSFSIFNLKLSHKGLLLVCLPLVFELVFVGTLAVLLKQAEAEIIEESHSKEVVSQASIILSLYYNATASLAGYFLLNKNGTYKNRFAETVKEIRIALASFDNLIDADPDEKMQWQRAQTFLRSGLGMLQYIDNEITKDANMGAIMGALNSQGTPLHSQFDRVQGEINRVIARYKAKENEDPAVKNRFRNLVQQWIAVGVMVNIVMALVLAVYFNRGTARRLSVVADNVKRLSEMQPLNIPLSGKDEIAEVDQGFHQMAKTLMEQAEALSAAANRERTIIENMPVGLVLVNESNVIESINAKTEELFGYQPGEMLGRNLTTLLWEDSQENEALLVKNLLEKAQGRPCELIGVKKTGERLPLEVILNEFDAFGGRSFLGSMVDITERHEIERLKQEFVSMVTHDLKTPLNSILFVLEVLQSGSYGDVNEVGQRALKRSLSELERLMRLINDLLDLERLGGGNLEINPAPVELFKIVERSVAAVQGFAQQHNIKLISSTDIPDIVQADEDRLVQVLVNLLSNAVKFSPTDSTVEVSALREGRFMEIRVTDRGRGIPESYREIIFERFKQVDAADASEKKGTGLGLAICKAIVEQHGGMMGVESEVGKGSTFWFRIPVST